jgi:putative tryptophan/tyrosine transport system substrate-binding protein
MRDLGYVEGRNIDFEFRNYGDDVDSITSHISDLLQAKVDIIVAGGTAAVQAAQAATQSIPIVMGAVADPMGSGLIASLARPGGNTTGLTLQSAELTTKRLELLKEVMPQAVRIAILQQPGNPAHPMFIKEIEPSAESLALTYRIFEARGSEDFARRSQGGVASSSPVVRLPKAIQPVRRRSRRGRSRAHETSRVHHAASLLAGTGGSNGYRLYRSFNRAIRSRPSGASAAVFL